MICATSKVFVSILKVLKCFNVLRFYKGFYKRFYKRETKWLGWMVYISASRIPQKLIWKINILRLWGKLLIVFIRTKKESGTDNSQNFSISLWTDVLWSTLCGALAHLTFESIIWIKRNLSWDHKVPYSHFNVFI